MPIYAGATKAKNFYVGGTKVKKIYRGSDLVFSAGNIVTYNFNGVNYTQEYDEGQSVLNPSVVRPAITGATFLGWVRNRSDRTPLSSLVMGSDPITLYALFKWNDLTPTLAYTDPYWQQIFMRCGRNGGSVYDNPAYYTAASGIVLDRYEAYQFYSGANGDIFLTTSSSYYWTGIVGSCGFRLNSAYPIMQSMGSFGGNYEAGNEKKQSIANKYFTGAISLSGTGDFVIKAEVTGGNGFSHGGLSIQASSSGGGNGPRLLLTGKKTTI